MPTNRRSAAVLLAFLAVGCGTSGPDSGTTASSQQAVPADPCRGATAKCSLVGEGDLDGDDQPERIAFEIGTDLVVRAVVDGELSTQRVESQWIATVAPEFAGAMPLTGSPGDDIVIMLTSGNGSDGQWVVLRWDDGFHVVPSVDGHPTWSLANSHGVVEAVRCAEPGTIDLDVHLLTTIEGVAQPDGGVATIARFRFTETGWTKGEVRTETRPDPDFATVDILHDTFRCD